MFIAECYANACFTQELRRLLSKEGIHHIEVRHKHTMGRDRILRDLIRIAKRTSDLIVAIIDYEEGIARAYVDKQFKISNPVNKNILLGINRQKDNLLAIIFDPNIEESLLCRIDETLCRDPSYSERIKSSKACNIIARYLKEDYIQEILHKLVTELKARVKKSNTLRKT